MPPEQALISTAEAARAPRVGRIFRVFMTVSFVVMLTPVRCHGRSSEPAGERIGPEPERLL